MNILIRLYESVKRGYLRLRLNLEELKIVEMGKKYMKKTDRRMFSVMMIC